MTEITEHEPCEHLLGEPEPEPDRPHYIGGSRKAPPGGHYPVYVGAYFTFFGELLQIPPVQRSGPARSAIPVWGRGQGSGGQELLSDRTWLFIVCDLSGTGLG